MYACHLATSAGLVVLHYGMLVWQQYHQTCVHSDSGKMHAAAGAVAVLEARRDALARRVEGLVRCKNEFQELARCL